MIDPEDNNLDDEINTWTANGAGLLRRIRDRRQKLQAADRELAAIEARTIDALHQLSAIQEAVTR